MPRIIIISDDEWRRLRRQGAVSTMLNTTVRAEEGFFALAEACERVVVEGQKLGIALQQAAEASLRRSKR